MIKNASRIVVAVVALAAVFGLFSMAEAQTYTPVDPAPRGATYEPPSATTNTGFLGFDSINPVPSAPLTDDTVGGTGGGLALTGSETDLGLAIGIGLLAVGGTAVVASRKRDDQ